MIIRHDRVSLCVCGLVVALAIFRPLLAQADTTGRVVGILDGDTISVLVTGREQRVRLAEIDAPEKAQAFGQRSKESLSDLVYGKTVTLLPVRVDEYGRTVAHVRIGTMDASLEQARRGMAWSYGRFAKDPNIRSAAESAKRAGTGLWADPQPVAPWVYRKRGRKAVREAGPYVRQHTDGRWECD